MKKTILNLSFLSLVSISLSGCLLNNVDEDKVFVMEVNSMANPNCDVPTFEEFFYNNNDVRISQDFLLKDAVYDYGKKSFIKFDKDLNIDDAIKSSHTRKLLVCKKPFTNAKNFERKIDEINANINRGKAYDIFEDEVRLFENLNELFAITAKFENKLENFKKQGIKKAMAIFPQSEIDKRLTKFISNKFYVINSIQELDKYVDSYNQNDYANGIY